ncbi:MAG: hypothetical protein AAFO79_11590 [Pseudomonadota bacterium]
MQRTQIRKLGKSTTNVVTLRKDTLQSAGLGTGDELEVTVRDDGVIELRPVRNTDGDARRGLDWAIQRYAHALGELAK